MYHPDTAAVTTAVAVPLNLCCFGNWILVSSLFYLPSVHPAVSPHYFPLQFLHTFFLRGSTDKTPSESLLVLFLSPPACQSLLVTKWFVGALSLDNFFCLALPISLPPSSSSLSLVPVTLLERAALRPGNEGNGRSVKHLLFNRADFCPHQEARNWTCLITNFGSITSVTLRCLQPRQWWYVNKVIFFIECPPHLPGG